MEGGRRVLRPPLEVLLRFEMRRVWRPESRRPVRRSKVALPRITLCAGPHDHIQPPLLKDYSQPTRELECILHYTTMETIGPAVPNLEFETHHPTLWRMKRVDVHALRPLPNLRHLTITG
jgi:hypothetical protein